jgi:pimeloyl-ACP methyl ester carboxylesterase
VSDRTGEIELASGTRLPYLVRGSGPAVVLLAPAGTSPRVWHAHQIPALVASGHQVVTIDYWGIHNGDAPPADLAQLVDGVASALGELGLTRTAVLGASMGGVVAQELVLAHPELVGCCLLLATVPRLDRFRRAAAEAHVALAGAGIEQPPAYRAVTLAQRLLSPATLNDERRIRAWLALLAGQSADQRLAEEILALGTLEDRAQRLKQLQQPCLVVSFADDRVAPPHLGRELHELLPHSEFAEFADAGHLGFVERPDAVNDAMLGFLARMRAGGAIGVDAVR